MTRKNVSESSLVDSLFTLIFGTFKIIIQASGMDYFEEQREEIESLKAIFPDEFAELNTCPPSFMIRLDELDIPSGCVQLKITFPDKYPEEVPFIEIPNRSNVLPTEIVGELLRYLQKCTQEYIGMAMVFTLVNEAKEWINQNKNKIIDIKNQSTKTDLVLIDASSDEEELADSRNISYTDSKTGGRWDYIIGLIGKPSAGKSTFFNAATQQNSAKIAAHPFTTIEPNIGKGFYSIPCPCSSFTNKCQAAFGHDAAGNRYVPVLLKDVAGLVPGACEGRGKGNKFLNDLLDADVLIHVIDVSGETDENGKETTGYDPTQDVEWLYQELHQWIFSNIISKWDMICKKPTKLFNMFTGYHASKHLIKGLFTSQGITEKKMKAFFSLNQKDSEKLVHNLVSEFLKVRFPILLALNKIDRPDSQKNIETFQEKFKDMAMVPVSAKSECFLQKLKKNGLIEYHGGGSEFSAWNGVDIPKEIKHSVLDISDVTLHTELETAQGIMKAVLETFGSTGVLKAVSTAVFLRPPNFAFPVQSLDSLESISSQPSKHLSVLRDCVVLKKNTTVGKLFNVLCHPPVCLLAGEYVRAECLDNTGKKRVMHKDEVIDESNQIVKIMSTKKASKPNKSRS